MLTLFKEEPHTNIKDLPKQLAKTIRFICYVVAYFDSVGFPSKDSFHTIGIRSDGFI